MIVLSSDSGKPCRLHITVKGMRILILREGSHLRRCFCRIVADHIGEHQSVCNAVRQVMERTQLMCQRVVHAQEGICKSKTCHAGGVCHLFSCFCICCTIFIRAGQIRKYILNGFQRQAVRIIGSHHGNVCLQRMGHNIDTGRAGQALRHVHHIICIDNGHIGQKLIISQRPFLSGCFIGDDGKGRYLGTGSGGGGDCHEISLFAHLREGINSLADIHEIHCHVHEIHFGMLIHHPHDLRRVHSGAAAQGDDSIRLKASHLLCTGLGAFQLGIRLYIIEAAVNDSHLIQLVGYGLCISILIKEGIRYDEGTFLVHDGAQLIESHRHAAALEINFFRCSEPKHVFSPFRNGLDVDQLFDPYIFRYGVSAPGSAAQCQRRKQTEVVEIADTALGRRSIHEDTAGLHGCLMLRHLCFSVLGIGVHIQRGGMTIAAVLYKLFCLVNGLIKGRCTVHGKNRGELLMSKRLRNIHGIYFSNDDLRVRRHIHTGHLCDHRSRLSDDLRIDRTCRGKDNGGNLFLFLLI